MAWGATAVIAVAALLLFWSLRPAGHLTLREVPAHELTLRDNRSYWRNESEPFTGIRVDHYPDGTLKSRSVLSNGVLHGLSEGWYTNGTLQIRETFLNGVSHGRRIKWYPSGARMSETPIEQGKIHGTFRRWHENGALSEEIEMSYNEPDGLSRSFYPNGTLKARVRLDRGKVSEKTFWTETAAAFTE